MGRGVVSAGESRQALVPVGIFLCGCAWHVRCLSRPSVTLCHMSGASDVPFVINAAYGPRILADADFWYNVCLLE